jgi:hypothetical protein
MNASGRTSWKVWISLLCAGFSLVGFLFAQTPDLEREQRLLLGQACFESERWEEAEKHFISCTQNQFARAQIHDLMEENAGIRPRHIKGAIKVSRIIPGMAYLYTGHNGKAIANFALIGGIAVGFVYAWPVAAGFGVFFMSDWLAQGSRHAEKVIHDATRGKRQRILARILELAAI